jgi:hypothetical protein
MAQFPLDLVSVLSKEERSALCYGYLTFDRERAKTKFGFSVEMRRGLGRACV